MKKILFIMPSMYGGGAERVSSILMNDFVERGIDVTLALTKNDETAYKLDKRVKIDKRYMSEDKKPISQILDIRKLMVEDQERVVISFLAYQNLYTILAGMCLKNRIVVSLRNAPQMLGGGSKVIQIMTKLLFGFSDKIVFQTEDAKKYYSMRIQKRGTIILNPLDRSFPEYNVEESNPRIVTFCRLNSQKNIPMAIRGFKQFQKNHSDYTYTIYGKGEELENIQNLINNLELENSVFIKDFEKDIINTVKDARMFVLTSDYEGMSNSMIEAMALGLPSICTDCPIGGARMVINDGENGCLIPVGDEEALVKAMTRIGDDSEFRKSISENSKKIREKLLVSKIVDQWEAVLFE